MATSINGKPWKKHRAEKRVGWNRMCLICGEEYEAEFGSEGSICQTCMKEYGIKPRMKGEYPCDRRKICRKCAHRVRLTGGGEKSHYICACITHTGEIRDLTANDNHCATFEPKGLKRYEDT